MRTGINPIVAVLICFLMLTTVSLAMGPRGEENLPPSLKENQEEGPLTIQKIIEDPSRYEGKQIVLEGTFRGWKGKCESSRPLTRSDWILEDESGCIYVTGKVPDYLAPVAPKGERIAVSGTVQTGSAGMPLIRADKVKDTTAVPVQ